ncbi:MAG: lipoate--protein ligase family protein [Promethearchaeota archaeon]
MFDTINPSRFRFPAQRWRFINDRAYPVHLGLAIDEMLCEKVEDPNYSGPNIIRFYQFSTPCVVIGTHQDVNELDLEFIKQAKLALGRRITGGGAILMGVPDVNSQLGVSIIIKNRPDFPEKLGTKYFILSQPILNGLRMLGLPVQYQKNSDITLNGKKITGQAIYSSRDVTFFHSTITLDFAPEIMLGVMGIDSSAKNIGKIKNDYTTIQDGMNIFHPGQGKVKIDDIRLKLRLGFQISFNAVLIDEALTNGELRAAEKLRDEKHATKEYIYDLAGTNMGSCFIKP